MCRKLIYLVCLVSIVGLSSSSYGVVIDSFEDGVGAWEIINPPETLASSDVGVTDGALSIERGFTAGFHFIDLDISGFVDTLNANDTLEVDVSALLTAEEVGWYLEARLILQGGSAGGNYYLEGPLVSVASPDGTLTTTKVSYNYGPGLTTGPLESWAKVRIVNNTGGSGAVYYDNMQAVSEAAPPAPPAGSVFGDWENDMDGWVLEPDLEGTTVEYSTTTGVTLNNNSLKMYLPGSGYQKTIWVDVLANPQLLEAFRNGRMIQMDVTRLAAEWPGDIGWGGQIHMVVNAGGNVDGVDWSVWSDPSQGWWAPDQGDSTQALEWDYSDAIAQIDFDNVWWLQIFIVPNCGGDTAGVYYFDNFRIPTVIKASEPDPANGATEVPRDVVLGWKPGVAAGTHDVFLGPNMNEVANATKDDLASYPSVTYQSVDVSTYEPPILELGQTYYWRIDEVNEPDVWAGDVWSFTVGKYVTVDDFEDYKGDEVPVTEQIWGKWRDGIGYGTENTPPYYPGNGTGSEVGDIATVSYTEEIIVKTGAQSMPYWYNNNKPDKAKYSEARMTLSSVRNWTEQDVKALYLYFRGYPGDLGGMVEAPAGTYTMTAAGVDIWDTSDEFHYAWKMLDSIGSITAKVSAITNLTEGKSLNEWAKAGLMIRETLDPGSKHAFVCLTGAQGVSLQYRNETAGDSMTHEQFADVSQRPHWIKLQRDISGNMTAYHADDVGGSPGAWETLGVVGVQMNRVAYIGLALTSHQSDSQAQAVFSNISTTGTVTGASWTDQDIGVPKNEAEPMYVAIANAGGTPAVVYHPDPNAALISEWTQWAISLKDFEDQGVDLTDVNSIAIGFGDRDNPQAGGSGKMYFDDIRLYRGTCILSERSAAFAGVDYAPAGDPAGDCVVNYQELEIMLADWLMADDVLAAQEPSTAGLVGYYPVNEGSGTNTADASGQGHQGTLNGDVDWVDGMSGFGKALEFPGAGGNYVDSGTWDPSQGTGQLSVAVWMKWAGLTGGYQGVVAKRDEWSDADTMWQIELNNDTGSIGFSRYDSYPDFGTNIPPVGGWQHVAVTFDGTTCEMYIDGKSVGTSTDFSFGPKTDVHVVFGAVDQNGGNPFNGTIDEVYLYNRALSSAEIAYLADDTPGDGLNYVPLWSVANLYDQEPAGSKVVNFMDFAVLADSWLDESFWP